jgi:hypothetical protein
MKRPLQITIFTAVLVVLSLPAGAGAELRDEVKIDGSNLSTL